MDEDEADGVDREERHERERHVAHGDERGEKGRQSDALGEDDPVRPGEGVRADGRKGGALGPGVDVVAREVGPVLGEDMDAEVVQGLGGNQIVRRVPGDDVALGAQQEPRHDLTRDDRRHRNDERRPTGRPEPRR